MNRWVEKLAVPSLLVFMALGMCFGENGLLHIQFDDYVAVNAICSVSLIFIMFYGGFGTNLSAARPVAVQSVVLSTLGVACTAGSVAVFVHLAFDLSWAESLLIGSVISSTDAASDRRFQFPCCCSSRSPWGLRAACFWDVWPPGSWVGAPSNPTRTRPFSSFPWPLPLMLCPLYWAETVT